MSQSTPLKEQRAERHLMRVRGAGIREVAAEFGFSFPASHVIIDSVSKLQPGQPPAKRRKVAAKEERVDDRKEAAIKQEPPFPEKPIKTSKKPAETTKAKASRQPRKRVTTEEQDETTALIVPTRNVKHDLVVDYKPVRKAASRSCATVQSAADQQHSEDSNATQTGNTGTTLSTLSKPRRKTKAMVVSTSETSSHELDNLAITEDKQSKPNGQTAGRVVRKRGPKPARELIDGSDSKLERANVLDCVHSPAVVPREMTPERREDSLMQPPPSQKVSKSKPAETKKTTKKRVAPDEADSVTDKAKLAGLRSDVCLPCEQDHGSLPPRKSQAKTTEGGHILRETSGNVKRVPHLKSETKLVDASNFHKFDNTASEDTESRDNAARRQIRDKVKHGACNQNRSVALEDGPYESNTTTSKPTKVDTSPRKRATQQRVRSKTHRARQTEPKGDAPDDLDWLCEPSAVKRQHTLRSVRPGKIKEMPVAEMDLDDLIANIASLTRRDEPDLDARAVHVASKGRRRR